MVEHRVAATPKAPAVVMGHQRTSFAQLDRRANQYAQALRTRGVTAESVVGVLLARGVDLVACLLGVWRSGAACLPLDPSFPAERLGFMLADSRARVLVAESAIVSG